MPLGTESKNARGMGLTEVKPCWEEECRCVYKGKVKYIENPTGRKSYF